MGTVLTMFSEKIETYLEEIWGDNDLRELMSSFDKINLAFELLRYEEDLNMGLNSYAAIMRRTKLHPASIRSILKYWEYRKIILTVQGDRKDKKHPVLNPKIKNKLAHLQPLFEAVDWKTCSPYIQSTIVYFGNLTLSTIALFCASLMPAEYSP